MNENADETAIRVLIEEWAAAGVGAGTRFPVESVRAT